MAEEFKRETRYIVFKIKDIENLTPVGQMYLSKLSTEIQIIRRMRGKPDDFSCVVVESDWPEYELVWSMIQARMEGKDTYPGQAIAADLEYLKQFPDMVVMEFSEDEKPIFTQGFNNHELLAPVTAKRCQEIIDLVVRYQADIDRLEEVASEYDELIRHMNTGGDFHEFMSAKAALREKASS